MSTYPIVGAYYRPPAQAILKVLPLGTTLTLVAEPDNEHDPNAIAIWLYTKDVPEICDERLEELLPDYGSTIEDFRNQEMYHLGYVPREMAATLRARNTVPADSPVEGSFSLSTGGAPRVRLSELV